jgi:hypothetical protein
MNAVWKCPNGHLNSFGVTEYSPDINCILADETNCEECNVEFDDKTWKFVDYDYDDPD